MATARIEGDNLCIILDGNEIWAKDWIEVESAPEQPGVVLYTKDGICVYLDRNGEPCDETTVRHAVLKGTGGTEH